MIKQITILTSVFIALLAVNITVIHRMNVMMVRTQKIHVILDELDYIAAAAPQEEIGTSPTASGEAVLGAEDEEKKDPRIAYLKSFMRKYESDLYDHAEFIVTTADKYGIDYRLVPAIAMQESGLCKVIPNGSHNCWGWGIYGNKVTRFASYPEAIETVSKGLKENYVDKGLTTPDLIMQKYTPSSNGSWARGVTFFLDRIE